MNCCKKLENITSTRLPSTLMAAKHSNGERPVSFQKQGLDFELQWLIKFFMSPLVRGMIFTFCRGILPPRPGYQLVNSPGEETHQQLLLSHLQFYRLSAQKYKSKYSNNPCIKNIDKIAPKWLRCCGSVVDQGKYMMELKMEIMLFQLSAQPLVQIGCNILED